MVLPIVHLYVHVLATVYKILIQVVVSTSDAVVYTDPLNSSGVTALPD